ncbi:hypothetical protein [Isoptericola halotolerans]|uniref:Mono/diheme cytochrome c family protein n=1 Tax=Isoptericola halotolerans TaxID=300560 RepID=A0ABX2A5S5_9MICO|nr:hypothetical protein [Isoptericola halotolerans]NOV98168.1 mono/diheme cytochrome c family protein [Isoptericola halotolerans]
MSRHTLTRRPSVERVLVGPDRVGNDGLTDRERARLAREYRETAMRPLAGQERQDVAAWLQAKRESRLA